MVSTDDNWELGVGYMSIDFSGLFFTEGGSVLLSSPLCRTPYNKNGISLQKTNYEILGKFHPVLSVTGCINALRPPTVRQAELKWEMTALLSLTDFSLNPNVAI